MRKRLGLRVSAGARRREVFRAPNRALQVEDVNGSRPHRRHLILLNHRFMQNSKSASTQQKQTKKFTLSAKQEEDMSTTTTPVYYEKGSCELAVETPVMMKRLEKVSSLVHVSMVQCKMPTTTTSTCFNSQHFSETLATRLDEQFRASLDCGKCIMFEPFSEISSATDLIPHHRYLSLLDCQHEESPFWRASC